MKARDPANSLMEVDPVLRHDDCDDVVSVITAGLFDVVRAEVLHENVSAEQDMRCIGLLTFPIMIMSIAHVVNSTTVGW